MDSTENISRDRMGSWSKIYSKRDEAVISAGDRKYLKYEEYRDNISDYCEEVKLSPLDLEIYIWPRMKKIMAAEAFLKAFSEGEYSRAQNIQWGIENLDDNIKQLLNEVRKVID